MITIYSNYEFLGPKEELNLFIYKTKASLCFVVHHIPPQNAFYGNISSRRSQS
jgi:hypothetical protein